MGVDTACIQAWVELARRRNVKELYAPSGIYIFDKPVVLSTGMHIRCAGPGATLFKAQGESLLFRVPDTGLGVEDIVIEDCSFDYNGSPARFAGIINISGRPFNRSIRIRGNRFVDSQLAPDEFPPDQRQTIVLLNCESCWVENNWLSGGGRIKVGRPGSRFVIRDNRLDRVDDNAITVVDMLDGSSSDILISGNQIFDPLGTGIFFGADGDDEADPALTHKEIVVAENIIRGDWSGSCIRGTLPTNTRGVHVVNNICTFTGADRNNTKKGIEVA